LRRPSEPRRGTIAPGLPLGINVYGPAFGDDPEVRSDASPINHIRPGLPPFMLICAEHDLPSLRGMAEDFHLALIEQGCPAQFLCVPNRNHNSIQFHAIQPDDPVAGAVLEFIRN
jgi:acetyl esterase/lipase